MSAIIRYYNDCTRVNLHKTPFSEELYKYFYALVKQTKLPLIIVRDGKNIILNNNLDSVALVKKEITEQLQLASLIKNTEKPVLYLSSADSHTGGNFILYGKILIASPIGGTDLPSLMEECRKLSKQDGLTPYLHLTDTFPLARLDKGITYDDISKLYHTAANSLRKETSPWMEIQKTPGLEIATINANSHINTHPIDKAVKFAISQVEKYYNKHGEATSGHDYIVNLKFRCYGLDLVIGVFNGDKPKTVLQRIMEEEQKYYTHAIRGNTNKILDLLPQGTSIEISRTYIFVRLPSLEDKTKLQDTRVGLIELLYSSYKKIEVTKSTNSIKINKNPDLESLFKDISAVLQSRDKAK